LPPNGLVIGFAPNGLVLKGTLLPVCATMPFETKKSNRKNDKNFGNWKLLVIGSKISFF
jgi:hypothetical protein